MRIRDINNLRMQETEREVLGEKKVYNEIDLRDLEEALRDAEEQEVEFYEEMNSVPEELIQEAEIVDVVNDFLQMDEEEIEEFFRPPEILMGREIQFQQNYW
ncbi:hypothetical protein TRFO_09972 [Tritrichomonas foetus]|uniref:Uncharacterized protein n=1 Tax=Tritrichomonas foetus TaxID=1144522 RepID=A0A1J4JFU2_9EUKA|nr:hypothetical protein TRFO_09972 [Tritrichomonas foetus]|eukprot:OHS96333.1 hypothetical protein TRFO_09972 [Tritrichomonas foetus]